MKKGTFDLKRRELRKFPPEKLYVILRGICPKSDADEKYTELTGLAPPKGEPLRKQQNEGGE